MVFYGLVESS